MSDEIVRFGRIQIRRDHDGVSFVDSSLTPDEEKFVLLDVVKGNPVGQYTRMEVQENTTYLQNLEGDSEEANISISLANLSDISDALVFLNPVTSFLEEHNFIANQDYIPSINDSLEYLANYDGLDGLLFSIFTSIKLVILGAEADNTKVILSGLALLPPELAKIQRFHTYSEVLEQDLNWIGMPPTKESMKQLEGLEFTHTIVSTTKNKTVTPYTCGLLKNLAQQIQNGEIDEAINTIYELYQTADELDPNNDPSEIADQIGSSIDDAEFLLKLKGQLIMDEINHPTTWR